MKLLNFGSLNYDYVYSVDHIVAPGETITSSGLTLFPGGKGLNQSIALARAGVQVFHAGNIGPDGEELRSVCRTDGVDEQLIRSVEERTGNAIIQVGVNGQNSIVLFPGANRRNDRAYIEQVLAGFGAGDMILLQNEINLVNDLIDLAFNKGMTIALNPSPMDESLLCCALEKVSIFLLNEVEAAQITGQTDSEAMLQAMRLRWPRSRVVLTLGSEGAIYQDGRQHYRQGIFRVNTVDTTAAGDTFTGFFLAGIMQERSVEDSLRRAAAASALAVSRRGAATSIPTFAEVENALSDLKVQV